MAALLCCTIPLQATDGLLQIGYGTKSKGMGGVGIALAQDAFAPAANPAGLTELCGRLDVGLHARKSDIRTETIANDLSSPNVSAISNEWDVWPEVGVVWGPFCDQLFGLAFYTVGESNARYKGQWIAPVVPDASNLRILHNTRSDFSAYSITPSWAWQINCIHSIGVAMNVTFGRLKIEGLQELEEFVSSAANSGRLTNSGVASRAGVSARFGWTAQFMDCLRVGATFQTKTYMGDYKQYSALIPDGGSADLPSQFGIGVTYTPDSDLVLSADVVRVFWRDGKWFRYDYNVRRNSAVRFGTNTAPGLGWNQQLLVKLGVAWCFSECLTLRGGFSYGNSPVTAGNCLNALFPETVNQHFTAGFTYYWDNCNEFSVEYVHGRAHKVSGPLSPFEASLTGSWRQWQRSFGVSWGYNF